jgi:hypothetical protein
MRAGWCHSECNSEASRLRIYPHGGVGVFYSSNYFVRVNTVCHIPIPLISLVLLASRRPAAGSRDGGGLVLRVWTASFARNGHCACARGCQHAEYAKPALPHARSTHARPASLCILTALLLVAFAQAGRCKEPRSEVVVSAQWRLR